MPNSLSKENSPYLLQHAENPVDWYPWCPEALEKARSQNKPIFLSIGYSACHWCHVMAHESFQDIEIATFMNDNFVNIKVDREERPDIDGIYMNAVVAITGQGGWPMSVFLTPAGEPFYGGTYFPPKRRHNMPSFRDVLESVVHAWRTDQDGIINSGHKITDYLRKTASVNSLDQLFDCAMRDTASVALLQAYDWKYGGWGSAPKFPQPMAIEFLLHRAAHGDKLAFETAVHALRSMSRGGMYDLVGGGFSRYSTDNFWHVPHFEKMLYDNAQLALAYLHGYLLSGNLDFKRVCEETLDFMARELRDSDGGFHSSLDADSEGVEGKYYLWTPSEIREALPENSEAELILQIYQVTEGGNFEGSNILQRIAEDPNREQSTRALDEDLAQRLSILHAKMLDYRNKRIRPATDDKVLVSWNALAMIAYAEAGRYLQRNDYLNIAIRNADFLLSALRPDGVLLRSWRAGQAQHIAFLEDHAALILGLLALYQSEPDIRWYSVALQIAEDMLTNFSDPAGGFFDTHQSQEQLFVRPKDMQDNATPSGNALAAKALLQLAAYSNHSDLRNRAEGMLAMIGVSAKKYPTAFGFWLQAAEFSCSPHQQVAIIGAITDHQTQQMVSALWSSYRPDVVAAIGSLPLPPNAPGLLHSRQPVGDDPTAYVCNNFVCNLPTSDPQILNDQLKGVL